MAKVHASAQGNFGRLPHDTPSWVIVLSGGQGERLASFVRGWLGEARPKQYCRFVGRHSMFEHTVARARLSTDDTRIVTVAAPAHRPFLAEYAFTGQVIYQPHSCGTAPGVLLPLAAIAACDPSAVVHILPSDHFIHPREKFARHLALAETIAHAAPTRLVLTAAAPDTAEADFGWIKPGRALSGTGWAALAVKAFHEKPDPILAAQYVKAGYWWNTMIVTCRAETLWQIASARLPMMMKRFDAVREAWHGPAREQSIQMAYASMPTHDFSRDLLERSTTECLLLPLRGIAWSDWGRPARIAASVAEFSLRSNYEQLPVTRQSSRVA